MATEPNDGQNEQRQSPPPAARSGAPVDRTTSPRAPQRSKTLTGAVVVLPILLLGGLLWLNRGPAGDPGNLAPAPGTTATASSTPGETATPGGGTTAAPALKSYIVYLPTDDGKLVRNQYPLAKVPAPARDLDTTRGMLADIALGALFHQGTSFFPDGSHPVSPCKAEKNVVTVDLNGTYAANSESWSSAETTTRVMSIVNTVAATDEELTSKPSSVRILVEGKPVSNLGELDTSQPIALGTASVPAP